MAGAAMEVAAVTERVGLALASQEVDTTGAEAAAPEAPVWTLDALTWSATAWRSPTSAP